LLGHPLRPQSCPSHLPPRNQDCDCETGGTTCQLGNTSRERPPEKTCPRRLCQLVTGSLRHPARPQATGGCATTPSRSSGASRPMRLKDRCEAGRNRADRPRAAATSPTHSTSCFHSDIVFFRPVRPGLTPAVRSQSAGHASRYRGYRVCSLTKHTHGHCEPVSPDIWFASNGCFLNIARNVEQMLGFRTGFLAASSDVVCASSKNEGL